METKKIRIHTLTPLFIGDGTELDFTSCWIDDGANELVEFTPEALKVEDNEIAKLGSMSLSRFKDFIKGKRPEGKRIRVSKDVIKRCNNISSKSEILKTASDTNSRRPYIPGSALKGALRTAYIASLEDSRYSSSTLQKWENNKEKVLKGFNTKLQQPLGSFSTDVFSTLSVSDFHTSKDIEKDILFVDRVSKKDPNKHMSVTVVETIRSGAVFEGNISWSDKQDLARHFSSIKELLEAADEYTSSLLADTANGIPYPRLDSIKEIKAQFTNKVTYLCRLGGYIGAESHTIDGHRNIKIMGKKGTPPTYRPNCTCTLYATATSKKPENNNITFGWCLIEVVEDDKSAENNQVLKDFVEEQHKVLFSNMNEATTASNTNNISYSAYRGNNRRENVKSWQNNVSKIATVAVRKPNRSDIEKGEVVRLSKKGTPMVKVFEVEYTLKNPSKAYNLGDSITVTSFQGTTCEEAK